MLPLRRVHPGVLTTVLVATTLLAGCATTGEGATAASRNPNLITTDDLAGIFVADLYQAVERLRPQWLTSRGARAFGAETIIAVVVDGNFLGGVEVLRQITTPTAIEIRRMDGAEATSTISGIVGSGRVVESAIIVTLGRGR